MPTPEELSVLVQQLQQSDQGRNTITHLLAWLDDDALSLDDDNWDAAWRLLGYARHGYAGSVRDALRGNR